MVERLAQGKVRWFNMKNPTTDEIRKVMKELDLPAILMSDLTTAVPKNSAVMSEATIKITLDFPVIKRIDATHPYEIKFLITKNALLTVQYEEMEGLDRFKKQFEVSSTLRKSQKHITGVHLFVSLMNNLYDAAATKLDYVESKLAEIEDQIFKNNEKQMVLEIANASKKLITFRHILRGHEDIFRELPTLFESHYGIHFVNDLQNLQSQYFSMKRRANTLFETITALRETNTAMLTTRQNEIIKNLTLMAFITFPLTLLSSMFGMNVESAPIIGNEGDFWIIVLIMLGGVAVFFSFFKYKGWV